MRLAGMKKGTWGRGVKRRKQVCLQSQRDADKANKRAMALKISAKQWLKEFELRSDATVDVTSG